ncbi:MAG TPA: fasciclin domain-containing protein [Bacteroidia bacterium]|nr:fasciclin domain-containing protein [Bacteroidia bacterium]
MKKIILNLAVAGSFLLMNSSCNSDTSTQPQGDSTSTSSTPKDGAGQSAVQDDQSQKNVVQVAMNSKDHTTLVTAIKAAELVDVLSNAGPFTVFAPTNDAFNKLPAGTVDGLLKPEKKEDLADILQYHVFVGVLKLDNLKDGQVFNMVNGGNVTIGVKDGKYTVNGANIVATVPASNGVIYVVDQVLLPPAGK